LTDRGGGPTAPGPARLGRAVPTHGGRETRAGAREPAPTDTVTDQPTIRRTDRLTG